MEDEHIRHSMVIVHISPKAKSHSRNEVLKCSPFELAAGEEIDQKTSLEHSDTRLQVKHPCDLVPCSFHALLPHWLYSRATCHGSL